jgi:hypothetical protein
MTRDSILEYTEVVRGRYLKARKKEKGRMVTGYHGKVVIWLLHRDRPQRQRKRRVRPFPLLGLDSDNGSEIINQHLYRYCQQERITFTRSRTYKFSA